MSEKIKTDLDIQVKSVYTTLKAFMELYELDGDEPNLAKASKFLEQDLEKNTYVHDKLREWLDSYVLDFDILISRTGDLKGINLLVAFGGPNIYVNTYTREISGFCGTDKSIHTLDEDTADFFQEYFSVYIQDLKVIV